MRHLIRILTLVILSSCSDKNEFKSTAPDSYRDISQKLSVQYFEGIKLFILSRGDRQSYCNLYNNNPHYLFEGFDVYLNPDIGQQNINCDTAISDFNILVIRDSFSEPQYYHLLTVRSGDLSKEKVIETISGMTEEKVYLLNKNGIELDSIVDNLDEYINQMIDEVGRE